MGIGWWLVPWVAMIGLGFADVVDLAAFGADPVVEELGTKLAVAAGGVGKYVPNDEDDGACDEGFDLADASGSGGIGCRGRCWFARRSSTRTLRTSGSTGSALRTTPSECR